MKSVIPVKTEKEDSRVEGGAKNVSLKSMIISGVVLAAIYTPVYLSIILDKIRDIKLGGKA
ncbi:MAG: hypothetical protein LBK62_13390 [Treponema sp.]|jgi:hypothetical protein|nr:hypothetical protein [Treponema sp.]